MVSKVILTHLRQRFPVDPLACVKLSSPFPVLRPKTTKYDEWFRLYPRAVRLVLVEDLFLGLTF
jgi:hypothetical protein